MEVHFRFDCWSSHCWLLILPPESTVNSVDHQLPHCWPSTLSLLTVDHRLPHCWPSTLSLLTVDHWLPHCWPSHCWLLTLSLLTVDSFPPPPESTVNSVDRRSPHCWPSVHFVSGPPGHSMRSTGWPLVVLKIADVWVRWRYVETVKTSISYSLNAITVYLKLNDSVWWDTYRWPHLKPRFGKKKCVQHVLVIDSTVVYFPSFIQTFLYFSQSIMKWSFLVEIQCFVSKMCYSNCKSGMASFFLFVGLHFILSVVIQKK